MVKSSLIKEFLIIFSFIGTVFISQFPPARPIHLIGQIFPILLWFFILTDKNRNQLLDLFKNKSSVLVLVLVFIFLVLCMLSLSYSNNVNYGLDKLKGLLINVLTSIIAFYFILKNFNEQTLKIFIFLFISLGICLTVILLTQSNISYDGRTEILLWSHSGTGRFLGFSFIVSIYYFYMKRNNISFIFTIIIIFGVILSGSRAVIIFLLPFYLISIFNFIKNNTKILYRQFLPIILLVIISFILYIHYNLPRLETRFINIATLNFAVDDSLNFRLEGLYKAIYMIKENPIFGWGIGGYDINFSEYKSSGFMRYPHNIIIEVLVELGILGSLYFIATMVTVFINLFNINKYLFLFFIFAFLTALFSGDIQYQKALFISISLLLLNNNEKVIVSNLLNTKVSIHSQYLLQKNRDYEIQY